MLARLPEPIRTPAVARAVTSPSALLLAGAGASAAILVGAAWPVAVVAGVAAWAARVAMAVPRRAPGDRVDPFAVGEPWRSFVQDALQAQQRFRRTLGRMREGPLRERLADVGRRIEEGVVECWQIARRGDDLDAALGQLDTVTVRRELEGAVGEETRAALQAQLEAAQRIAAVSQDAHNRLRVLTARLDEAVARAIELSVRAADLAELAPLSTDVDALVGELEALRVALQETA